MNQIQAVPLGNPTYSRAIALPADHPSTLEPQKNGFAAVLAEGMDQTIMDRDLPTGQKPDSKASQSDKESDDSLEISDLSQVEEVIPDPVIGLVDLGLRPHESNRDAATTRAGQGSGLGSSTSDIALRVAAPLVVDPKSGKAIAAEQALLIQTWQERAPSIDEKSASIKIDVSAMADQRIPSNTLSSLEKPPIAPTEPNTILSPAISVEIEGDAGPQLAAPSQSVSAPMSAALISHTAPLSRVYAHPVATQIAAAVTQSAHGATQIALNPAELGRVRITLMPTDIGMTVVILTERPETADLMRRNLNVLVSEFKDLGHENVSFSFDDHPTQSDSDEAGQDRKETMLAPLPPEFDDREPAIYTTVALTGGLDLKL